MLTERQPRFAAPASSGQSRLFLRRHVWWIVAIVVIVFSAALVRWAGTRPGYDPYGWLIWGYQALHGSLSLSGAPSWKPLPLLFTFPAALFGHFQLWIWMTLAVAASLAGCVFAGRIAFRIVVDRGGAHHWPAVCAAIFAGAGLLGIQDNMHYSYLHYVLSVQSDPPIVALCLAAIDLHLTRHRRWAIAMLVLASLGRPETWPFLFLYALYCWREDPEIRTYVIGALLVVPLMWFGIPTITNHNPLVAANLAQGSPRQLHSNKILGTLGRFKALNLWPVWAAAGIAVAWAAYRRNVLVLILFGCAAGWVVIEIGFALHGWPGVPRYVFEPAGVSIVLAGIAFGWILGEIPRFFKVPWWLGLILAAGLTAGLVPGALSQTRDEHRDIKRERARTTEISRLAGVVHVLGGKRQLEACGSPVVDVEYASVLGWLLHVNTDQIGYRPEFELHKQRPIVLLTSLRDGWAAYPWHTKPAMLATCNARTKVLYVFTGRHPNGIAARNPTPPVLTPLPPKRKQP